MFPNIFLSYRKLAGVGSSILLVWRTIKLMDGWMKNQQKHWKISKALERSTKTLEISATTLGKPTKTLDISTETLEIQKTLGTWTLETLTAVVEKFAKILKAESQESIIPIQKRPKRSENELYTPIQKWRGDGRCSMKQFCDGRSIPPGPLVPGGKDQEKRKIQKRWKSGKKTWKFKFLCKKEWKWWIKTMKKLGNEEK